MANNLFRIEEFSTFESSPFPQLKEKTRLFLEKGELSVISTSNDIKYLAYLDLKKDNKPRANHYHKEKVEHLYLIQGRILAYFKSMASTNNSTIKKIEVNAGSLITVFPNCAHAVDTIEDGCAIEFSPHPVELIREDVYEEFLI